MGTWPLCIFCLLPLLRVWCRVGDTDADFLRDRFEAQDAVESKSAHLRHLYKRAIILLRTLYSFVRMVPAYQVSLDSNRMSIGYKYSSYFVISGWTETFFEVSIRHLKSTDTS